MNIGVGFLFFVALLNNWSQIVFDFDFFFFPPYKIKAVPEMKYQWGEEKCSGKKWCPSPSMAFISCEPKVFSAMGMNSLRVSAEPSVKFWW